jgi:phosphinothricin acetyltransferase
MRATIQDFQTTHWKEVSEIYRFGLLTRNATFETEVPEFETFIKKFHRHLLWVAMFDSEVVGWAGLQPVSTRTVYEGVSEVSIYVHPRHSGKGIGSALMKHLVTESEGAGIWSLYGSIFPENTASINLHLAAGFRAIGYRERIAKLGGEWRNTALYERRSKIVGN